MMFLDVPLNDQVHYNQCFEERPGQVFILSTGLPIVSYLQVNKISFVEMGKNAEYFMFYQMGTRYLKCGTDVRWFIVLHFQFLSEFHKI